eukprot:TRINITY_DN135621_c1_g1_i1.p1 TRINITY_DN135621_c1_g1~~TRINITY_DN135621_c1_g1_i1.p1  ORF type:complete len:511 (-),score=-9.24 TRINITY_DN135621_c1_g1_i1:1115-2647(-)
MRNIKGYAKDFEDAFNAFAPLKEKSIGLIFSLENKLERLISQKPRLRVIITQKLRCTKCKTSSDLIQLPCFHSVCATCLTSQIEAALRNAGKEELLKETVCPKCEELVPEEIIKQSFKPEVLSEIIEKHGLDCWYCGSKHSADKATRLSCGHTIGKECFKDYLNSCITNNRLAENNLSCQLKGCDKEFQGFEMEKLISKESLDRITRFRIKNAPPVNGEAFKFCAECDSPQCIDLTDSDASSLIFKCYKCGYERCIVCSTPPHPDITCSQNMARRAADDKIEQQMIKNGQKFCPSCNGVVAKREGCNCIYCALPKCQPKRNKLCNLCGIKIHERDHCSHFFFNPYGNYCKLKCQPSNDINLHLFIISVLLSYITIHNRLVFFLFLRVQLQEIFRRRPWYRPLILVLRVPLKGSREVHISRNSHSWTPPKHESLGRTLGWTVHRSQVRMKRDKGVIYRGGELPKCKRRPSLRASITRSRQTFQVRQRQLVYIGRLVKYGNRSFILVQDQRR